jgi:DNA-binding CsgD family transcriptional regulator
MGATPASPAALLEATATQIEAGSSPAAQLEVGLRSLLALVGADRGDVGVVAAGARAYRPDVQLSADASGTEPFEVPLTDPLVRSILATPEAVLVPEVAERLEGGPVRDLLVGSSTRSILVRRLDDHDDGCGLVCIDWVDLAVEAVELVDWFVSRVWSPLLAKALAESRHPAPTSPLACLTAAERSVVELAASGCSYAEIADARRTSVNTVNQQLRSARHKAGVRNTAELCSLLAPTDRGR